MLFDTFYDLLGDAFILDQTNEEWKLKRKICAHAFYKDKLLSMTNTMRKKAVEATMRWKEEVEKSSDGSVEINLTDELSHIFARIIITICLGEDLHDTLIPMEKPDGSIEKMSMAAALRWLIQELAMKIAHPLRGLSTSSKLFRAALNSREKLSRKNCTTVR